MPINPTKYIWFNGELVPWEKATVHVMTHALHYGSSVFEGIRCYKTPKGPAVFRLAPHTRRLFDSAKIYRMELPYTQAQINEAQTPSALYRIAAFYKQTGDMQRLVWSLQRLTVLMPNTGELKLALASVYAEQGAAAPSPIVPSQLDFRVGKIVQCEKHPDAD